VAKQRGVPAGSSKKTKATARKAPPARKAPSAKRRSSGEVAAAHAVPRRSKTKPSQPAAEPVELTPIDATQRAAIAVVAERARAHLLRHVTPRSSPEDTAAAIDATVSFARDEGSEAKLPLGDLAALYGSTIVRAARWRWYVWRQGEHVAHAVVSPKKTHAVRVVDLLTRQSTAGPESGLLALLQEIVAGDLPAPRAGDPIVLG
jgi:hypothetical protein